MTILRRFVEPRLSAAALLAAFVVFLFSPGVPASTFSGAPLTPAGVACFVAAIIALAFIYLFKPTRATAPHWTASVLILIVINAVIAHGAAAQGWRGVYQMMDSPPSGPVRFMTGFSATPFRIDGSIDFDDTRFGLAFYNDVRRYGSQWWGPRRDVAYPFVVEWTGYAFIDTRLRLALALECRGRIAIAVDRVSILDHACAEGREQIETQPLLAARHEIVVTYTKPAGVVPRAIVASAQPLVVTPWAMSRGAVRRMLVRTRVADVVGFTACVLIVLALTRAYWPVRPPRAAANPTLARVVVFVVFATFVILGFTGGQAIRGLTVQLPSGDDPLVYESFGRDVLFNGLLMPDGARIGHGAPYYFYPFYSYGLAAVHLFFGEDQSGVVLFNRICIGSLALMLWQFAWKQTVSSVAVLGAAALGVFCYRHYLSYSLTAFTDNLFVPLVVAAIWASVNAVKTNSTGSWAVAGVASAFAAATRPSFMTYPGILGCFVVFGMGRGAIGASVRCALSLWAGFLVGLVPFALRNWIMARKFVLLVNSWIQIPYFLFAPEEPNRATAVAGLGDALGQAFHIFTANPSHVVVVELRKIGFTFGLIGLGPSRGPAYPEFLILCGLFLAALVLRRVPRALAFVLCAFAVSHVAAMILAAPWTYGYKTILPLHVCFLLGATFLLAPRVATVEARSPAGVPVSS